MEPKCETFPYSIRCLRAIEGLVGGRAVLADKLGLTVSAINRWVNEREISKTSILDLTRLSENKFTAEELLGKFDGKPY